MLTFFFFSLASAISLLQVGLAQQEWRIPSLLHKSLRNLTPHLSHPFKAVREKIGWSDCPHSPPPPHSPSPPSLPPYSPSYHFLLPPPPLRLVSQLIMCDTDLGAPLFNPKRADLIQLFVRHIPPPQELVTVAQDSDTLRICKTGTAQQVYTVHTHTLYVTQYWL